jgi:hypothetical protein
MNTGFGISKLFTANSTPSEVVFFDTADPNTGGTVFDPNTPSQTDTLYVSSSDASTWVWNGSAYVGYTAPTTVSTPFYLYNTTIDAGSNKTASISRNGVIAVINPSGLSLGTSRIELQGFYSAYNGSPRDYLLGASNTATDSPRSIFQRWRGTLASALDNQTGNYLYEKFIKSKLTDTFYQRVEATENHGTDFGVKVLFQSVKNGNGSTLEDRMEFTENGTVKVYKQQANVQSVVSSATVTPNADTDDEVVITAQAEALTIANPSGTPTDGQPMFIRIFDDGTARGITWGANYAGTGLPTTTVVGTSIYVPLIYNSSTSKWDNIDQTGVINSIPTDISFACSDETTALTTGTSKVTFRMPYAMTVTEVRASLTGAGSTSGTTTIDINEGGVSILSTKLTIDFGDTTSVGATTPAVISDSALADNSVITVDIDAITGGADETGLKVYLIGTRLL